MGAARVAYAILPRPADSRPHRPARVVAVYQRLPWRLQQALATRRGLVAVGRRVPPIYAASRRLGSWPGLHAGAARHPASVAAARASSGGHKPTAWAAAWTFLTINGIDLMTGFDVDAAELLMNNVATQRDLAVESVAHGLAAFAQRRRWRHHDSTARPGLDQSSGAMDGGLGRLSGRAAQVRSGCSLHRLAIKWSPFGDVPNPDLNVSAADRCRTNIR